MSRRSSWPFRDALTDICLLQALLTKLLRLWPSRALISAWLAVVACAVCGTFEYAVDQGRGSSTTSQAQRLLGEDSVAALERRLSLQAPANKQTKHGPAGNADDVGVPNLVYLFDVAVDAARAKIPTVVSFKRRLLSNSQPRAPPRGSAR